MNKIVASGLLLIVLGTGLMALQLLASVADQIQSLGTTGREAPRLDRG